MSVLPEGVRAPVRSLSRAVARRRGLLAAGLTAGAVATALPQLVPPTEPGVVVLAAARDLAAGQALSAADVVQVSLPPAARPDGALPLAPVEGLRLAGPVRRGEPLTDARVLGAGLLGEDDGLVAVPVRLADPASTTLLQPGDRIDVLAAAADGRTDTAPLVAASARVLAVPPGDEQLEGGLVVLATTPATAARLAAAAVSARLSVVLHPRLTAS